MCRIETLTSSSFATRWEKKLSKLCKVLLNIKYQKSFRYPDEKVDKSENLFFPSSQHTKKIDPIFIHL
jgi:hypothetical protein